MPGPGEPWRQSFRVERDPHQALDAAEVYLDGAGLVSLALAGRLERSGDSLVVHHGRMETRIEVRPDGSGAQVEVERRGQAPLVASRRALYVLGLLGALAAWGLAYYHNPLEPLVTAVVFFLAILTAVVVLYVVDRSLERRSEGLLTALEDAVRGDPFIVLRREVQELERASSLVNGMLAYCVGLLAEALVFVILLRNGIDDATTLAVMRQGFLLPVVPAALFGLVYFFAARGIHRERLRVVEERLGRMRPTNRPRRHPQ